MEIPVRVRVAAYILRQNSSDRSQLLVFRHPDCPDAPLQIPAGGVEYGEPLEAALRRETWEESGLTQLRLIRKLGVVDWCWLLPQPLISRCHCFLLQATSGTADCWNFVVQGAGLDAGLLLSYFWIQSSPEFRLHGSLGDFLNPEAIPELFA
jgi:8-oxo-dGTP pyrophosphatase MutT (NUDIX family)